MHGMATARWLLLLICTSALIASALIANQVYVYVTYVVPLANHHELEYFVADIHHSPVGSQHDNYAALDRVTLLEDGSIDAVFKPDPDMKAFQNVPHFEHTENIKVGQTFVVKCQDRADLGPELNPRGPTIVGIFQYLGTVNIDEALMHEFYHVTTSLKERMPCNYPEVIRHSIDVIEVITLDD